MALFVKYAFVGWQFWFCHVACFDVVAKPHVANLASRVNISSGNMMQERLTSFLRVYASSGKEHARALMRRNSHTSPLDQHGFMGSSQLVQHSRRKIDDDPNKCRDGDGSVDKDCCAGSDASNSPGYCADGYQKRETSICGVGSPWCDANGCMSYTCVPPRNHMIVGEGFCEKYKELSTGSIQECFDQAAIDTDCTNKRTVSYGKGNRARRCLCDRVATCEMWHAAIALGVNGNGFDRLQLVAVEGELTEPYAGAGSGVAGPGEIWNVGNAMGKGLLACYHAVMADARCAKDYFTYVHEGDKNCSCKGSIGALTVTAIGGASTYYRIKSLSGHANHSQPLQTEPHVHCEDTAGWTNGAEKLTCRSYVNIGFCHGGRARAGKEWTLGSKFFFPERNCCACGKSGSSVQATHAITTVKKTSADSQAQTHKSRPHSNLTDVSTGANSHEPNSSTAEKAIEGPVAKKHSSNTKMFNVVLGFASVLFFFLFIMRFYYGDKSRKTLSKEEGKEESEKTDNLEDDDVHEEENYDDSISSAKEKQLREKLTMDSDEGGTASEAVPMSEATTMTTSPSVSQPLTLRREDRSGSSALGVLPRPTLRREDRSGSTNPSTYVVSHAL